MNAFTYYEPISNNGHYELMAVVLNTWRKHGWNPIVLGRANYDILPESKSYEQHVRTLPTINSQAYEMSCYRRWLVMASIGGGMMIDYDVVNFGFSYQRISNDTLVFYDACSPCVVSGNAKAYQSVVDLILKTNPNPNENHVSDMTILNVDRSRFIESIECKEYGQESWENSRLVHFASFRTQPRNKIEVVKEQLEKRTVKTQST